MTVEEFAAENHNNLFDVVCCLEVIEHVRDPASMLLAASRLLKKSNGLLFVSTINETAKSVALTIVGAEYALRCLPVGTHQWTAYKSPQDVRQLLLSANTNLREVDVTGMVVSPSSLPAIVTRNQWNWQLDPNNTDVNWIGCYRNEES